jgi:hypothetical protein
MTLVASFEVNGHPVFVNDILISSIDEKSSARIPTIGAVANIFPEGSGYVPTSLRQKTAILGPNVVVGWSGMALSARIYCTTLRDLSLVEDLTLESIDRITYELAERGVIPGLNIIGSIWDKTRSKVEPFEFFSYQSAQTKIHGNLRLLGTGSTWFGAFLENSEPVDPLKVNEISITAALSGQAIAGACMGFEVGNGFSLMEYFGGGYEVTTLWPDGFKKLSDVTTLVWYGRDFEPSVEFTLSLVSNSRYIDDYLNIQVWRSTPEATPSNEGASLLSQVESYLIEPAFRTSIRPVSPAGKPAAFNSKIICNYFIVGESDQRQCKACVEQYGNDSLNIEFYDEAGFLGVKYHQTWMQNLLSSVANEY